MIPTDCETPFDRDSCIQCALKHLSQAFVLSQEVKKGYPHHYWFAMGHMAEAEDELLTDHAERVEPIREQRLLWQVEKEYKVPFADLVDDLVAYDERFAEASIKALNS